jgi:purine-cytosine permease-like protein
MMVQLGFSVTAVILGGQTLHAVNHNLPLVVGVIIIGVCSLLVCFVGYNLLHHYERYAW